MDPLRNSIKRGRWLDDIIQAILGHSAPVSRVNLHTDQQAPYFKLYDRQAPKKQADEHHDN